MNKLPNNGFTLIDSENRSKTHSETWEHPPQEMLDRIQAGYFVKVGVTHSQLSGERFWGLVKERIETKIKIEIDQDMLNSAQHGLNNKDIMLVEQQHVFGIVDADGVSVWPVRSSTRN